MASRGAGGLPLEPVTGEWRWSGGALVTMNRDGTFRFGNGPPGYFFATSARHFVLVHENGRVIDYATLDPSGEKLVGGNSIGGRFSAERIR